MERETDGKSKTTRGGRLSEKMKKMKNKEWSSITESEKKTWKVRKFVAVDLRKSVPILVAFAVAKRITKNSYMSTAYAQHQNEKKTDMFTIRLHFVALSE